MNKFGRKTLAGLWMPVLLLTGCNIDVGELLDELEDLEIQIGGSVGSVQDRDPRDVQLPDRLVEREETIVIDQNVNVIIDISDQLVIEELPDINLIGFENLTGWDIYISYFAEDTFQSVLVYADETLLLEYPCLLDIELIAEEDYDPFTGEFIQEFDLSGTLFLNPEDYECGDALIISIDPDTIVAEPQIIDLVR